jgi:protein-S-isoprenylcysteine O-methyltransferase Ste14
MTDFDIATLLTGCICFAAFSWGVTGHFRSTGAMPPGMKLTSLLSLGLFLAFAFRLIVRPGGGIVSLALFTLALAIFAWAVVASRRTPPTLAFDTDQPSFLMRHGPYRLVRHPFYLAYLLFWTGTAAATLDVAGWLAPVVMLALYRHAAGREERKFAGSALAPDYADYRMHAGMFLPLPTALFG